MTHHTELRNSNQRVSHRVGGCTRRCWLEAKDRAVVTTRSTQDDSSPRLLQLPIEIRDLIYERVLGGRLLHRSHGHFGPKWIICRATISEKDAQRHFDQAKAPAWCVENDAGRHAGCYRTVNCLHGLDLNLLLACRQVHGEAKHILFSTNTFSFIRCELLQSLLGLDSTTKLLLPCPIRSYRLAVCSIHIDISLQRAEDAGSWNVVMPQIAQVLPNLRNINISFNQDARVVTCDRWRSIARDDAAKWEVLMQSLLSLASLPLRSATFDINDKYLKSRWLPELLLSTHSYQTAEGLHRWTLEEKQSRARAVREAILKPSS